MGRSSMCIKAVSIKMLLNLSKPASRTRSNAPKITRYATLCVARTRAKKVRIQKKSPKTFR